MGRILLFYKGSLAVHIANILRGLTTLPCATGTRFCASAFAAAGVFVGIIGGLIVLRRDERDMHQMLAALHAG